VNFLLGLALINPFGLQGVVTSTLLSHTIALLGVLLLCKRNGMNVDRGVLMIVVSLIAICLGKWVALLSCVTILSAAVFGKHIFSDVEKKTATTKLKGLSARLSGTFS